MSIDGLKMVVTSMAALSCILLSQGVQDNMTKLRMMSDRMCGANHFASDDLNHHIAKLNSRWVRHNELMGLRKRILEGATNFHQLQEKVMNEGAKLAPKQMIMGVVYKCSDDRDLYAFLYSHSVVY